MTNIYLQGKTCTLQDNILDYTKGLKYQLKSENSSILSNDYEYLEKLFNEKENG